MPRKGPPDRIAFRCGERVYKLAETMMGHHGAATLTEYVIGLIIRDAAQNGRLPYGYMSWIDDPQFRQWIAARDAVISRELSHTEPGQASPAAIEKQSEPEDQASARETKQRRRIS
jgi:hypothetical protein